MARNATQIAQEIADTKHRLEVLEAERKALNALAPLQRLANIMHDSTCTWNHTDGCGWGYESWDGATPAGNSTRSRWLEKARQLVSKTAMSADKLAGVFEIWQEIE